ncbi:transposase [Streptomyces sp. NPDC001135]
MSDARWALVEPLLTSWWDEKARYGLNIGTPPQHNLRDLPRRHLLRDPRRHPWRYLPHDQPHGYVVYGEFGKWERYGIFEQLNALLRRRVREDEGRSPESTG